MVSSIYVVGNEDALSLSFGDDHSNKYFIFKYARANFIGFPPAVDYRWCGNSYRFIVFRRNPFRVNICNVWSLKE